MEGLGLQRVKGRVHRPWALEYVRDLTEDDLRLALTVEKGIKAPALKRLSERHHALARRLASGLGPSEAAFASNIHPSTVSILLGDPTFKELVRHYREIKDAQFVDMHAEMAGLGYDAVSELRERLAEDPEAFKIGQLLEAARLMADRTGFGPTTKTDVNVTVGIADRLEIARKRVEERRAMIDITPLVKEAAE